MSAHLWKIGPFAHLTVKDRSKMEEAAILFMKLYQAEGEESVDAAEFWNYMRDMPPVVRAPVIASHVDRFSRGGQP